MCSESVHSVLNKISKVFNIIIAKIYLIHHQGLNIPKWFEFTIKLNEYHVKSCNLRNVYTVVDIRVSHVKR